MHGLRSLSRQQTYAMWFSRGDIIVQVIVHAIGEICEPLGTTDFVPFLVFSSHAPLTQHTLHDLLAMN